VRARRLRVSTSSPLRLPPDLFLGPFDPARVEGGIALRYTGLRGTRFARIARVASLVGAALAPLAVLDDHRPEAAMDAFRHAGIGVLVAAMASMIENVFEGAYRKGRYRRVGEHLTIVPQHEAGYRSPGRGAARVEVDGQLVSEALPERVVISRSLVRMPVRGMDVDKIYYHVSLVFHDMVLRVARFATDASDAKGFASGLAEALDLPKPKRCDEPAFESSFVGMTVYAFMLVVELMAYAVLCVVASWLSGSQPPAFQAEAAVLTWMVVHLGIGALNRRWGQKQLTQIAIDAFGIDPEAGSPARRPRG
jgi:hypothetical protein